MNTLYAIYNCEKTIKVNIYVSMDKQNVGSLHSCSISIMMEETKWNI